MAEQSGKLRLHFLSFQTFVPPEVINALVSLVSQEFLLFTRLVFSVLTTHSFHALHHYHKPLDTMICKMKHIRNLRASMRVPVAPHPHQHLLFIVSHTTGCVVGSQGALISLSLMTNQVEHPSRHLLAIQIYIFSGEMSIKTFCPF